MHLLAAIVVLQRRRGFIPRLLGGARFVYGRANLRTTFTRGCLLTWLSM